MAKVNWTFQALEDIDAIATYHEKNAESYAFLVEEILNVEEQLSTFPYSGRVVPESNIESIREVLIHNYRVIYSIADNDIINILAVRFSGKPLNF